MSVARIYLLLGATAAAVVAADQLTKQWALDSFADEPLHLIGSSVSLRVTYNSGGAFGLLPGAPGFFLVATILVMIAVLVWARSLPQPLLAIALGGVVGGGAGNLVDRIFRSTPGVVDWIDVGAWPVFNLADSAIVCGVAVLLLFSRGEPGGEKEAQSTRA